MWNKVLCVLAVYTVAEVSTIHVLSSQYILKHDGHHHLVHVHGHGHGHYNHKRHHADYYTNPKYDFKYTTKDPHSSHNTLHHEDDGEKVKGYYTLHQPDGTIRHVHYLADKHTGFHADVKHGTHHPHHHHHHYHHHHHHRD